MYSGYVMLQYHYQVHVTLMRISKPTSENWEPEVENSQNCVKEQNQQSETESSQDYIKEQLFMFSSHAFIQKRY